MKPTNFNLKIFSLFIIAVILTLGLSIAFQSLLAAWTEPLHNPPVCNSGENGCDAPLNVSAWVQSKAGPLWINTSGASNPGLWVTGNVGIGTASPQRSLQVEPIARTNIFSAASLATWGDVIVKNSTDTINAATGIAFMTDATYHDNAGTGIAAVKTHATDYQQDLVFITRPYAKVAAERMRITSYGNLGIGTATPAAILNSYSSTQPQALFNGYSKVSSAAHSYNGSILIGANSSYQGVIDYNQAGNTVMTIKNSYNNSASLMKFTMASTDVLAILGSGNVGIGTTAAGAKLDISGSIPTINLRDAGSNADVKLRLQDNAALTFFNTRNGGVTTLHVNEDWASGGAGYHSDFTELFLHGTNIYFGAGDNTTKWVTMTSGNVGIGITSPGAKLEIYTGSATDSGLKTSLICSNTTTSKLLTDANGNIICGTDQAGGGADADAIVGNEVTDTYNTTLTRRGSGARVSPYTLELNLGSINSWTGAQTFNANTSFPGSGIWNSSGNVGIGIAAPAAKLQINPPASAEGLRIVSASNWSPLNIRDSANAIDIFRVDQTGTLVVGTVPWANVTGNVPWARISGAPAFLTTETDPQVNTLTAGKWCTTNGSVINCTTNAPVTSITAGTGLSGGTITTTGTINADATYLQRRVTGTCAAGSSIRVVNVDGTVTCQTDNTGSSQWTTSVNDIYNNNTGNVGIGTITPAAKLEVQGGSIKATGGLIIETRTSDPTSPATGQMWLRTDINP